jgi:hypothetical protein
VPWNDPTLSASTQLREADATASWTSCNLKTSSTPSLVANTISWTWSELMLSGGENRMWSPRTPSAVPLPKPEYIEVPLAKMASSSSRESCIWEGNVALVWRSNTNSIERNKPRPLSHVTEIPKLARKSHLPNLTHMSVRAYGVDESGSKLKAVRA